MTRTWTADEVRALGVRTDLVTACSIMYGCGRTKAYELHRAGQLAFPALECGSRITVPVAPLLALLGLEPRHSDGGPASPPLATTHEATGGHDDQHDTAVRQATRPLRSA